MSDETDLTELLTAAEAYLFTAVQSAVPVQAKNDLIWDALHAVRSALPHVRRCAAGSLPVGPTKEEQ